MATGTKHRVGADRCSLFDVGTWTERIGRLDRRQHRRQALGAPGLLLGWTPWLQSKVSAEATKSLDAYIKKHPEALLPGSGGGQRAGDG